jgi:hypothetical protein
MSFDPLPGAYLTWDESSEPLSSFLRYQVYRRVAGETTWNALSDGRITDRSLTAYLDYAVESGVLYEYDVTQWSDSSGEELESDHTVGVQGTLIIRDLFIHDASVPDYYAQLHVQQQTIDVAQDIAYLQPWAHQSPTAHVGNVQTRTLDVPLTGQWGYSQSSLSDDAYRALLTLVTRQRTEGSSLIARQGRDVFLYCVIDSGLNRQDSPMQFGQRLKLREVE